PAWFRDRTAARATYISASPAAISEVIQISARGWVTPAEEARLLGYPKCCVEDYHRCTVKAEETFFRAVMRVARGDEQEARQILSDNVKFRLSDEEEAQIRSLDSRPCLFTSVDMCAACAANDRSPARVLSRQYAKLAKDLDPTLFATLEQAATF